MHNFHSIQSTSYGQKNYNRYSHRLGRFQFIKPPKNQAEGLSENDISLAYEIPEAVHEILVQKCYDCHSNNTVYPWYSNLQPVGWFLYNHIREGKDHLNFSEFKSYPEKRAVHKLEELSEAVTDGWMPLDSYLWMHPHAKISAQDTEIINAWIQSQGIDLSAKQSE
jgi:hypothetical protein